jgi:hypothetical protein
MSVLLYNMEKTIHIFGGKLLADTIDRSLYHGASQTLLCIPITWETFEITDSCQLW